MSVPGFQEFMLPLLKWAGDGKEHSAREAVEHIAVEFKLSEEDRRMLVPSGVQTQVHNRVSWVVSYFKKAGLVVSPRRARFTITDLGRQALQMNPQRIDIKFLKQYPAFTEFQDKKNVSTQALPAEIIASATPEETLALAHQEIRKSLASEILSKILSCPPQFFEQLVVDLLVKMGYGGSREDAGSAVGRSGDEGIDGIIKEDRLGLDQIYLQAKRWQGGVGRPEIQKFIGALAGQRAKKGVFITTSSFSDEARKYAEGLDQKIILIDGGQLAELMIEFNLGVTTVSTYTVERIDSDYFSDE